MDMLVVFRLTRRISQRSPVSMNVKETKQKNACAYAEYRAQRPTWNYSSALNMGVCNEQYSITGYESTALTLTLQSSEECVSVQMSTWELCLGLV